ncbi:hypothetical protein CP8484711_1324B, partial [Chlamydia psittaci 84-8471/1]
CPFHNRAY